MIKWRSIAITVTITLVYVLLGGLVIHFLEHANEDKVKMMVEDEMEQLTKDFSCMNQSDIDALFILFHKASRADIYFHPLMENYNVSSWSIESSIFLAAQLVTGLAYGNIIPRTVGGRIFVVFYTIIGFPFFIISSIAIGEFLIRGTEKMRGRINKGSQVDRTPTIKDYAFGIVLILLIGMAIFVITPSIVFTVIEGWNYEESLYYIFISLFNLGFGDYIPATELTSLFTIRNFNSYRLFVAFYILLMAMWFATIITAIYEAVVALSYRGEAKKIKKEKEMHRGEPVRNQGAVTLYTGEAFPKKSKSKTTVKNSETGVTNVYFQ